MAKAFALLAKHVKQSLPAFSIGDTDSL